MHALALDFPQSSTKHSRGTFDDVSYTSDVRLGPDTWLLGYGHKDVTKAEA